MNIISIENNLNINTNNVNMFVYKITIKIDQSCIFDEITNVTVLDDDGDERSFDVVTSCDVFNVYKTASTGFTLKVQGKNEVSTTSYYHSGYILGLPTLVITISQSGRDNQYVFDFNESWMFN